MVWCKQISPKLKCAFQLIRWLQVRAQTTYNEPMKLIEITIARPFVQKFNFHTNEFLNKSFANC
jgi:hypothetical protein